MSNKLLSRLAEPRADYADGVTALSVVDPSTGARIALVPHLGAPEALRVVEAARGAFGPWSRMLAKARGDLLRRWFNLIIQHQEELAAILTSEQGKPLAEARAEIAYAASFVEFYAEEARRLHGEIMPAPRAGTRLLVQRQPVGVVAAITPWNFPAAMVTRKLAPALAAGCTVVLKPAPETPLTALALAALAVEAGIPPGVINVITGDAKAIGEVFCAHAAVRFISFTGSTAVGKLLMRQAADGVKKLGLELGGNAPFIVFEDADLEAAADGLIQAKFRNAGQTCVCPNRVFVQARIETAFIEALCKRVAALKVGDGREPDVTIGPLINARAVEKVEAHVADALAQGARLILGGKRHAKGGHFFEPTILAGMNPDMRVSCEETFGPLAALYTFETEDGVIAAANDTLSGLAGYFYSRDVDRIFRVADALEVGMVGVNTGAISSEVVPFGGIKESGLGREGSRHGIDEFTELKAILIAESTRPASLAPQPPRKDNLERNRWLEIS